MAILNGLVISVTGNLPHDNSQLKKWIEANGGLYSPNVHKSTTHLLAGKDAWKSASNAVQAAVKQHAWVIQWDWLEDSLLKGRKLAEKQYTWEGKEQDKKRAREMRRLGVAADTKRFVKGCEDAKRATGTGTSKSRPRIRKPRVSRSVLVGDMVNTPLPFVSAAETLKRKREEREAAKAAKAAEQAARKQKAATKGVNQTPDADAPSSPHSQLPSLPSHTTASTTSSHTLAATQSSPSPPPSTPAKKPSLKDLYHYYIDASGFEFKTMLTRCDFSNNTMARYRLSILESHAKPNVYCTFVEYFPPGVGDQKTAGSDAAGGADWIQALLDFNRSFPDIPSTSITEESSIEAEAANDATQRYTAPSPPANPPSIITTSTEPARLTSLIAPTAPSPSRPHKSLIAPMSSPFPTAFATYRTAFHDLTLLTWEERFDTARTLYKARAAASQTEPFVWVKPKPGLPNGLQPQIRGLYTGDAALLPGAAQGGPTTKRNTFNLPALDAPLANGVVGRAVREDRRRAVEEEEERAAREAERRARDDKALLTRAPERQRPDFNRPLFNGLMGRPTIDAWGNPVRRFGSGAGGGGGRGWGVGSPGRSGGRSREGSAGVVERRRAWPRESGEL